MQVIGITKGLCLTWLANDAGIHGPESAHRKLVEIVKVTDTVLMERHGGVVLLRLNRPDKLNAINGVHSVCLASSAANVHSRSKGS